MSRYTPLQRFLADQPPERREVRLTFGELERIVGPLPASARNLRTWWGNSTHGQATSWQAAGWIVDSVNLTAELVVFVPVQAQRRAGTAPMISRQNTGSRAPALDTADTDPGLDEATVQGHVVSYLARTGWQIRRVADTASRERGIDILASKSDRMLAIEVKGYPSRGYTDPRRAGETKLTRPASQARHWYSHVLLQAMLIRDEHPAFEVAVALPDMPTYRSLYERTARSLHDLRIRVVFVTPDGDVTATHSVSTRAAEDL